MEFCYNLAETVRSKKMGVLTPRMSLLDPLRTFLDNMLPEDAHVIAKNRLFVSVTDTRTRKNHLFCDFESKEHLIQVWNSLVGGTRCVRYISNSQIPGYFITFLGYNFLKKFNLNYTLTVWKICVSTYREWAEGLYE